MPIAVRCKSCQKSFVARREYQGRETKCPNCGEPLQIPNIPADTSPAAERSSPAQVPAPEQPAEAAEPSPGFAKAMLQKLMPLIARCWLEVRLTAAALWDAARRVGSFARSFVVEHHARRVHEESLRVLGEQMAERKVGDSALLKRLRELEASQKAAAEKNESVRTLKAERRRLLIQLASVGTSDPAAKSLEEETRRVAELGMHAEAMRTKRQESRGALAPPSGNRRRVVVGVLVILAAVYFLRGDKDNAGDADSTLQLASIVPGQGQNAATNDWQSAHGIFSSLQTSGSYSEVLSVLRGDPEAPKMSAAKKATLQREWNAVQELLTGQKPTGLDGTLGSAAGIFVEQFTTHMVRVDGNLRVAGVQLHGPKADDSMKLLTELTQLQELDLSHVDPDSLTDRGLQYIPALKALRSLNLQGLKVSNEALSYIASSIRLEVLNLNGTRVADEGLRHLDNLVNLKELGLQDTKITNAGLPQIAHLAQLHSLLLYPNPKIDAESACKALSNLKKLDDVQLLIPDINSGADFFFPYAKPKHYTPAVEPLLLRGSLILRWIEGMTHFKNLTLTNVYDEDMHRLASFPNLERLTLLNCTISGKSLEYLHGLKELRYLTLKLFLSVMKT